MGSTYLGMRLSCTKPTQWIHVTSSSDQDKTNLCLYLDLSSNTSVSAYSVQYYSIEHHQWLDWLYNHLDSKVSEPQDVYFGDCYVTCCVLQWLCTSVAALLHYLFLAVFCWMLCEGIMLFLMLVIVFSTLAKRRWFFLLIGWGERNFSTCALYHKLVQFD